MTKLRIFGKPDWQEYDLAIGHIWWRSSVSGRTPTDTVTVDPLVWAKSQDGNWAAIIQQADRVLLITDGPRSFPILYAFQDDQWLVSSNPQSLLKELHSPQLNKAGAEEFLHTCFVLGEDTLVEGVKSVPAASAAELRADGTTKRLEHTSLLATAAVDRSQSDFFEAFHADLLDAFRRLIDDANGRQFLIPLSGGADSRLILAVLHELGAQNVHAFTYGFPQALEAKLSREVAEGLGYPWHHVTFSAKDLYRRWWQPETNSFLQDCWAGSSLPHIQDWYALGELRENPEIHDDAIVLPGHTIVGNEHDDWCFDPRIEMSNTAMAKLLAKHHLNQQGRWRKALRNPYTNKKVMTFIERYWPDANPERRSDLLVAFNLAERQAKYINNSMRGYEHFGFEWALPMLEKQPWMTWLNGPKSVHDSARVAYKNYVQQKYTAQSGKHIDYWGVINRLPKPMTVALAALEKLRLRDIVERIYTAHVCLNHPMGLEGFAGGLTKPQLARRLYSGAGIIGVYAQLFIEEKWVPNQHVLPSSR